MSDNQIDRNKIDRNKIVAAILTFLIALAILLFLFLGGLRWDRMALANASTPEIMDDDPLFVEPELVDLGEADALNNDLPAPSIQGEPKQAEEENTEIIEPGTKTEPSPPVTKLNTSTKENDVKAAEPSATDKERKEATSVVASKFSSKNGTATGTNSGTSGAGGDGIGVTGSAHGRSFISCPKPDVALRHKTVVKVNVVIDANGNVTEASASGSADASIRKKCEEAAKKAKWSAKKGAGSTRGSITFTITPR